MDKISIGKKTTIQSYGELWDSFLFLKEKIDPKVMGWSNLKLSALTIACFAIEAFANHMGQELYPTSWDDMKKRISPIDKLKMFIKKKKMEIKYGEASFNAVGDLMQWRNKVAHAGTVKEKSTQHIVSVDDYEDLLNSFEQVDWREYVLTVDIEKIKKDCEELMKTIHLKAFGHLNWFLAKSYDSARASVAM